MLALFLVFLFAFILLSLITHIYYSFLFLHPTLKLTRGPEIEEFLTHLAVKRQVSASTQNQALNTAVFLFKHIMGKEPGEFKAVRTKQRRYLPVVLSQAEVQRVLDAMDGVTRLMAEVMYGGGSFCRSRCSSRRNVLP